MRTLLSAYKASKDNANSTGASPCLPPFMQEMDEIFGDKPIISNTHTLHLGRGPTKPLEEDKENEKEIIISPKIMKRKSTLQGYKEEKLNIKRMVAEKKIEQRELFYNNIVVMLKDNLKKNEEIEHKKVEMLEKILNKN